MRFTRARLLKIHESLLHAHGPQHWWSATNPFEIMMGAVLVQHTQWRAVTGVIHKLKAAKLMTAGRILDTSNRHLTALIRSAGTPRIKTQRLKALSAWVIEQGGVAKAAKLETDALRHSLLAVHGIGPETADCILLYAFQRPMFIADAYARRFFTRYGFEPPMLRYEPLQCSVESVLNASAAFYDELHALIVRHCKNLCRSQPLCEQCMLNSSCAYAKQRAGGSP
jgi:endonuclease-3 related protein